MNLRAIALASVVVLSNSVAASEDFGPVPAIDADAALASLGKRLFFDVRLSGDASTACASCHNPDHAFSDGMALSNAYPGSGHFRNTPTLVNTAQRRVWMHDGRMGTNLNDVTREMITESYLMNMDMRLMQERIKQDPVYVKMFDEAGLGEPSNGGVRKAIPEYLKTLSSRGAAFDTGSMTDSARLGFDLFKRKAGCAQCHTGPRFSDDQPHNLGVPENNDIWSDPLRHVTYVTYAKFMGVEDYMNLRRDVGAYVRTHTADGSDIGRFVTPTLRELKYTAPYMHNGVFETLDEVVDFYSKGGGDDPNKDPRLAPLNLSKDEKADLIEFLMSLSGDPLTGKEFVWSSEIPKDYPPIADWRAVDN